ncbi:MAG: hypothetical protein ACJ73D_08845 [Pyrinomonadaceae bacterium]
MPNSPLQNRGMAVLVMLATIAVIAVNYLAATGHINGVMPNEISDKYPTVITPAGWAFSIWSLIYTGLIGFSIYQLLPSRVAEFTRVRLPYIVSCVLNISWILLWHHFHVGICGVVIALFLVSLMWVNFTLDPPATSGANILTKGVFGLYAGWVTAATLVNFVISIVSLGIQWSGVAWSVVGILCLGTGLAAAILVRVSLGNFIYPLPIAWAAAAIGANQSGKNTAMVIASAILCIACLIVSGTIVTELKGSPA